MSMGTQNQDPNNPNRSNQQQGAGQSDQRQAGQNEPGKQDNRQQGGAQPGNKRQQEQQGDKQTGQGVDKGAERTRDPSDRSSTADNRPGRDSSESDPTGNR
jgi:hypothetical protein